MNNSSDPKLALSLHSILLTDVDKLMPIENACHSHPWSKKTFQSCIGGRYFGEFAQVNGQIPLGFYIGQLVMDEATLMDICVEPKAQGKGYGKVLLKQFLTQAKKHGAAKIWLEVREKNVSAQLLYMNAGFVETNRRTGYYPSSSGFGYEDAIVMSMSL